MSNKLYVGNLNYEVTDDQLGDLFGQTGQVASAVVIKDKFSGRSKGFGFVEMTNADDAKKAIEEFNGKEFQGRNLIVNEARPPKPRDY